MDQLPQPTILRLNALSQLLEHMESNGVCSVSSSLLGQKLGVSAHSIRKDISFIGEIGNGRQGYDVMRLRRHIAAHLGLDIERNACVVGLGRLGSAVINYEKFPRTPFRIVAGFDASVNRLEMLATTVPLFPAFEMEMVVRRMSIAIGILAVPASAAQEAADCLARGGARGILNFTPAFIQPGRRGMFIRNIDIIGECGVLAALIAQCDGAAKQYDRERST